MARMIDVAKTMKQAQIELVVTGTAHVIARMQRWLWVLRLYAKLAGLHGAEVHTQEEADTQARARREFANGLDRAERFGAAKDEPEGSRYIQMSDTLARQLAAGLRGSAGSPGPAAPPEPSAPRKLWPWRHE